MREKRFVYILKEKGTTFYRIGSTHLFNNRKKLLKQGNPREFELVFIEEFHDEPTVMWVEKHIQRLVSKFRCKDSWYKIPNLDELDFNIGYELMRLRMEHELTFLRMKHIREENDFHYKEIIRKKSET
jgi:predicted GIY-YIG superfamily endonuclease